MRALIAFGALLAATTGSCAAQGSPDPGNLVIRCPDAAGAVSVSDGQVTLGGIPIRVAAELGAPTAVDEGLTFAIEVHGPASGTAPSPSVQCVRVRSTRESAQWDAVPRRIDETRDGANARVRAVGRDGPHWRTGELVDVTVWLKVGTARHVLTLPGQLIRTIP